MEDEVKLEYVANGKNNVITLYGEHISGRLEVPLKINGIRFKLVGRKLYEEDVVKTSPKKSYSKLRRVRLDCEMRVWDLVQDKVERLGHWKTEARRMLDDILVLADSGKFPIDAEFREQIVNTITYLDSEEQ